MKFIFDIYHKELTISETTGSIFVASYLDLLFARDETSNLTTERYDKHDAFGFHIVNFPFMSSNIPSSTAYDVIFSQLIKYARCCSNYSNFLSTHVAYWQDLCHRVTKSIVCSTHLKKSIADTLI